MPAKPSCALPRLFLRAHPELPVQCLEVRLRCRALLLVMDVDTRAILRSHIAALGESSEPVWHVPGLPMAHTITCAGSTTLTLPLNQLR